jgi:hypothetical protein
MAQSAPQLGQILVRRGAISPAEVEQALENQLIFGGRVGTNLVELGRVRLDDIGTALAAQHGVPAVDAAAVAGIVPEALELVSTDDCARYGIIPLRVDGAGRLVLGMRDPLDFHVTGLAAHLGRELVPMAMPEMRFHYLLERYYGVPRAKRFLRLPDGGERKPGQRSYLGASVRPATGKMAAVRRSSTPAEAGDERATRVAVAPVAVSTAELVLPESLSVPARALADADAPHDPIEDPASTVLVEQLPRGAAGRDTDIELQEQDLELVEPRPLDRLIADLDGAERGGDVARLLVAPLFEQSGLSVLFWVRGSHAVACCAEGASATEQRVQQLSVGLDTPSALQWAVKLRGVVRVDGTEDATQYQIASFLGTALPGQVCVAPVLLRAKVVNLICLHSLPRAPIPDGVVNELRELAEAASRAYERLRNRIAR